MSDDHLKLTCYFGERDRVGSRFLADALSDLYARHELQASLVMRGTEGFGLKHHLRNDRLLTLSEDLPIVSVAVDRSARVEAALSDVEELRFDGLVTLERARLWTAESRSSGPPAGPGEAAKLTVYLGRAQRVGRLPAYEVVVAWLHARGVAGASVLLGIDGTAGGVRRRARFFASNADVPLMVIAVGDGGQIADLLPELGDALGDPLTTLERVRVCKRDGQRLGEPPALGEADASGHGIWQKLTVYGGEQSRHEGRSLHQQLIRELRESGAAGATTLRGVWGYQGRGEPHGDKLFQLRRRVPIVTVVIDTPTRIAAWFEIVDRLTAESGLVTSETVPALRATASEITRGGLALAALGGT